MHFIVAKCLELFRFQESNNHLVFRVLGDSPGVLEIESKSDFLKSFSLYYLPAETVKIFCLRLLSGIKAIHNKISFVDLKRAAEIRESVVFTIQLVQLDWGL